MPSSLTVRELFALLEKNVEHARAALGTGHVLVPLEPWVMGEEPTGSVTLTGRGHLVSTHAGKQVPVLLAHCFALRDDDGAFVVGRTSRAEVEVDQPTVSRLHAQISCVRGVYSAMDRGSYNGTLVNHRVIETGEAVTLSDGDVLVFGEAQLVFGALSFIAELIKR